MINFGGYWRTWQGLGWAIQLDEANDEKTLIRSAMLGGLLGIFTTSPLTRKIDLSLGDASIINYSGLGGTWLSLDAGTVAGIEDTLLVRPLIGGNLSVALMESLSSRIDISFAQANLINLGGIVGTTVASGLVLIMDPDSEEIAFAILMAGGIAGLITGVFSTRGVDRSTNASKAASEGLSWYEDPTKWNMTHGLGWNHNGVQINFLRVQF